MSEPGPRVAAWLGTVSDLLREHLYEMPHQVIAGQLGRTFRVTAVAHTSSDPAGRQDLLTWPGDVLSGRSPTSRNGPVGTPGATTR